jgi:hypothetical protein
MKLNDKLPWATIGTWLLAIIFAVVGAIQCIQGKLDFEQYGKILAAFAVALGILGVGRGIAAGKR